MRPGRLDVKPRVVANFAVNSEAGEQAYLQRYFEKSAGEYRLAHDNFRVADIRQESSHPL